MMKPMKKKTRILIADDHAVVRMGLAALLSAETDMTVVGQSADGAAAVADAARLRPDVVIMDLMMPKLDGVAATDAIHRADPTVRIILLTSFSTADGISRALEVGASGALLKTADGTELARAIREALAGRDAVSEDVRKLFTIDPPIRDLTERQRTILAAMAAGRANKEIAAELGLQTDSVRQHVIAILAKLGAANRAEAVAIAMRKHLLKT